MFEFMEKKVVEKEEYKARMEKLRISLGDLQRKAKEMDIPVLVILEGMDASGKGGVVNELLANLDPRGYRVYSNNTDTEEEKLRPKMWKFWKELPAGGEITIFDRSWYYSSVREKGSYEDIIETERLLVEGGMLIVKIFLHISKKGQGKRLKELEDNPSTSWKVTKKDWKHHEKYNKLQKKYDDMIEDTSTKEARWNIISSDDMRSAKLESFEILVDEIQKRIDDKKAEEKVKLAKVEDGINLDKIDTNQDIDEETYKKKLKKYQKRLHELEHEIYEKRIPVIIAYEGWDAAGKGGNIKRVVGKMDPRGYDVIPIAAPSDIEKKHHYLWRFWTKIPKGGHIAIFDRTWYGRVLVERVEGFCSKSQWKRAYSEIKEMEKQWTDEGAVVLKFWIHIDKDEQLKRFKAREENEYKKWKITDEDWRNREKWDDYKKAVEDMIDYTSVKRAPWHIIEGNSKYYARLKTMKIIIEAIEKRLKKV